MLQMQNFTSFLHKMKSNLLLERVDILESYFVYCFAYVNHLVIVSTCPAELIRLECMSYNSVSEFISLHLPLGLRVTTHYPFSAAN